MTSNQQERVGDNYVLATGPRGAARLELLHAVYGPATERVCLAQGLREGWRVADIGCGAGQVSTWLATRVGPSGHVTGVDASGAQLDLARARAARLGLDHVTFVERSAYELALPAGSFDLVFCRLLLCHLQRPADALRQMAALLRPGGKLIAQDLIGTSIFTDPPSRGYQRFVDATMRLSATRGVDYCLGRRLNQLLHEIGLANVDVCLDQPCYTQGDRKRFWEYTWLEAGPAFLDAGILTRDELDELAAELATIGADDRTLVAQACMPAAWGTKRTT
jgi:SAM-dependent methyltransferase